MNERYQVWDMVKYFFLVCDLVEWRHITPLPPHNGHLSSTASKLCPQGGHHRGSTVNYSKHLSLDSRGYAGLIMMFSREKFCDEPQTIERVFELPYEGDLHARATFKNRQSVTKPPRQKKQAMNKKYILFSKQLSDDGNRNMLLAVL